jgi:hypothetical protein
MLTSFVTLQQGRRLRHLLVRLQQVATWNLHTTQPSTLLLTYDEVVDGAVMMVWELLLQYTATATENFWCQVDMGMCSK